MKHLIAATALLFVITACSTTEDEPRSDAAPKAQYDGRAFVQEVRRAALDGSGIKSVAAMCKSVAMKWQCFFDGLGSPYRGRLDVKLSIPGDFTGGEVKEMSKDARTWWLNMAGLDVEDLDTVVSFVDGRDTGTSYRRDNPMLNR